VHTVLVTGATGFVGRFLCTRLLSEGRNVRGTIRSAEKHSLLVLGVEPLVIEPLGPDTNWSKALEGIDTVIHLAARVHIMNDKVDDPLAEFRLVNTLGTKRLAEEAARAGVKRFVFISTIKVNGEETAIPYTRDSLPNPSDPYGISKWEAEQALRSIERKTGLEVVVIRPPLVYGPGVKANFLKMMHAIQRGIPLPLASLSNRRNIIYVGNIVDSIATCCTHPKAAGQTYLVSDGEDVSTPDLVQRIASALGRPARLVPFPTVLMRVLGKVTGKSAAVDRLLGSLVVDSSKIRSELGWKPPFSMEEGLAHTARWYKSFFHAKSQNG